MLQFFMLSLLGLVAQNVCVPTETPEQAKRCDKKSVLTIRTECQSCLYNLAVNCPDGYTKVTKGGSGVRDCRYWFTNEAKTYTMSLPGCRHICKKDYMQPQCCPGHWGPDCLECPGGARAPCSGRGSCAEGMEGTGSCSCHDRFGGTACEACVDSNFFGPNCSSECSCVHGVCNSGVTGDGTCECYSAYTGPNCDQPVPACAALLCPEHARCVPSSEDEMKLECKCLPGYKGDGKVCAPINPCSQNVCPSHSQCTYLGPNRHRCTCQEGYHGDGQVCLPIDPCQDNFGGCPPQSTVCKYDGPAQSHCECREHYRDFVPGVGCSVTDLCESRNPCHQRANCTTVGPGQTRCTCQRGYVGDGLKCYGNILERLRELNVEPGGKWQGKLTAFTALLDKAYGWPLSNLGPFTVLVTTDKGLKGLDVKELSMDTQAARYFVKLHIIAGQMSSEQMNNTSTFYTLTGKAGEIFNGDKDNQLKLKLFGGKKKVKIIQGDIIASNGLLHILDKAMDSLEPSFKSNTEQTIMTMLQPRYSKFRSLLEKTNMGQALEEDDAGEPYTIFVPRNEALDAMKAETLDYLLSAEGSRKLLELIRYHIVPFTQLEVASLVSTRSIRSMANQMLQFNVTSEGQIQVNGVAMEEIDLAAKNGRIYTLNGVLVPPSIVPILPHRCDETKTEMKLGTCLTCSLMHLSKCPANSEPTMIFTQSCASRGRVRILRGGCARYCNATVTVPQCCPGFYGRDCSQCPGGFLNPCSGNGQCSDGIDGDGLCTCRPGFHGSHCQFCSHLQRYGPRCDRKCQCIDGTCDNRVDSDGACLPGTCRAGSAGRFCHKQTSTCGPHVQFCHIHATCQYSNGTASCVCKAGYSGDGSVCSEMDPCVELIPGGCSPNAECLPTGAGTHACVCRHGWTGDGRDCSEINECLQPARGGCHHNATCLYVGPGQHECECNKGFQGNGIDCQPVTSCLEQTGMCHPLATCQLASSGLWGCVCRDGYEGDGLVCYGNAAVELLFLSEAAQFNQWINNASLQPLLSTASNLTILVPSQQAIEDMDQEEKDFWLSESNIPALIKHHLVPGTYGVTDLLALTSADVLPTSLQGNFLRLAKADGNITLDGASIIAGDNAATNGVIHVINKVLVPQRGLTGSLPSLLTRLDQMPDYSAFRGYIMQYNLASAIEAAETYTLFAPSNDAIARYIREKKAATLEEAVLRYHVVLGEKLLKNDLHNGMHRETMLGFSYLLGFFLRDDQLYVNEAPINYTNVATDKGVIHGLTKVLEIQKNRCDNNSTAFIRGKCGKCFQTPLCPLGTEPHSDDMRKCISTTYSNGRRSLFIGCQPLCVKTIVTRECCAGFFGSQCQACPGRAGDVCYGNGICLDGANGNGTCVCGDGFEGTACETCHKGKYGAHCDQVCSCVHGRCSQGPSGDGSCECDVGWRGVRCDQEITKDDCNGTCHTSANCLLSPYGIASCRCAAGFRGNGTTCVAINACETRNGGCSALADCRRTTPGNRLCVCRAGYTGDGIVCLEINPCLENNGGCHQKAECTQTGPNRAVCNCLPRYTGDGRTCALINSCLKNNGGCSHFATCNHTELDERVCTCKPNYVGDGITCRGNIYQELPRNPKTSQYFFQLMEHSVRDLAGPGPFTVFAPLSAAFDEEPRLGNWSSLGLMAQILRYHVVGCHQLDLETLKVTRNVTSLQGDTLLMHEAEGTVYINNVAKVLYSDIVSTNGIIHIIDKLLTPQNLLIAPKDASGKILQNLTTVAANYGYVQFSNLIQDTGLLGLISDPIHTPVTLFWPSDRALQALPAEKRDFLFSPDSRERLREHLKFHVVRDAKVLAAALPRAAAWKTLQGSELRVKCGVGAHLGELFLNDQNCRIVQREIPFDLGVIYSIDCLLIAPTLGGRCDVFTSFNVTGDCGSCLNTPSCPRWSKPKGVKRRCQYNLSFRRNLEGCQHQCALVIQVPRCCKGYFGRDCQACPGGPDSPCNNRGVCLDQYWSTGECRCNTGFNGTACELCERGRFGPDCQPCSCSSHGQCDEGITGSGQCFCETGWTGRFCDTQLVLPPVCTPPCSVHAICKENNTCECGLNYEGDGVTCTVVNFCAQDNGGCAKVAKCSQTDTRVSCSCPKGYQGDGRSCTEIDPCADGLNGGCHEHATCTMTGPGKQSCRCKAHYVGDGLNCEPEQMPVDRCLQDHGQCHADAHCADLHFQDTTVGVFHLRSPRGQYKMTFYEARQACAEEAASMATYSQLSYAQKAKFHLCSAGWLDDGRVAYPTAYSSRKCGSGVVGIVDYGPRNKSEMWDVFCFRMKDVNCTCKAGYVGDGVSCVGSLLQVLMSRPSLTSFLMEVLAYSNSSSRGHAFLQRLSSLSTQGTLFVPQNAGLQGDQVLSGRDIEHHLTNVSVVFYSDLVNGTTLRTRLGSELHITSGQEQHQPEAWFVDGRTILQWDLIAANGIIHIISGPLKAPPAPAHAGHTGLGMGIFFAIILVIGAVALAAYSYLRLNRRTIGFQHFESEEDVNVAALGKQPEPENITNPMYESMTSAPPGPSYDPFTDSDEQHLDSADPLGAL